MSKTLERNAVVNSNAVMTQFLTFSLNEQEFGIDILKVQEINNFKQVTPLPNVPDCIKGVINLRGAVVPIVDLRIKLNMPAKVYNQFTVIIVVNVGKKIMGLVVDAVSYVLDVDADSIDTAPDLGSIDTSFIKGLAKSDDRLVTLLDLEHLLCEQTAALANV